MRQIFADTWYWIALTDPSDRGHLAALNASSSLGTIRMVTSEAVLIEVLNFFADSGPYRRREAARTVGEVRASPQVEVVSAAEYPTLTDGLALYIAREDKGYSLTDCLSMLVMREREIYEVITRDAHFAQEGFVTLPR